MAQGETYQHWITVEELTARPLPWKRGKPAREPYRLGWRAVCKCGWHSEIRESRGDVIAAGQDHKDAPAFDLVTDVTASAASAEPAPVVPVIAAEIPKPKLHDPWAEDCDCPDCHGQPPACGHVWSGAGSGEAPSCTRCGQRAQVAAA